MYMTQEGLFQDLKVFIEDKFDDIKKTMATQESLDEVMIFLNDTVATKEDLKAFATKDDLSQLHDEMRGEFIDVRYKMTDIHTSISVLDGKVDQIQVDLGRLNKRDEEDIKALGNDVFSLKKRVSSLEGKRS